MSDPTMLDKHFSVDFDFTLEELLLPLALVPPATPEQQERFRQSVFDMDQEWFKEYMNARP